MIAYTDIRNCQRRAFRPGRRGDRAVITPNSSWDYTSARLWFMGVMAYEFPCLPARIHRRAVLVIVPRGRSDRSAGPSFGQGKHASDAHHVP